MADSICRILHADTSVRAPAVSGIVTPSNHGLPDDLRVPVRVVTGGLIDEFSHQRYTGSVPQTRRFIEWPEAAEIRGMKVIFRDSGERKSAFDPSQQVDSGTITAAVNSGRGDFSLREFRNYFPGRGLQLPALGKEKG